jgi:cell division protein FtsW
LKEKHEDQNLPENMPEEPKAKGGKLKLKINKALVKREEDAANNDVIFYSPLKEETKDESAPLHKGSIDMWFLLWALLIVSFGVVMSYSASAVFAQERYDSSMHFFIRHIGFTVAAAIVTAVFVIFARPWHWRVIGVGTYIASVVLLLVVLVAGSTGGGAQRWIAIGSITIQPSEIAKTAVVMVLALYLSKYEKEVNSTHKFGGNFKHGFFMPMIIIGILCGLIALQPHLSGLMIVGMIGVAVMYLGGTRMKWLAAFLGIIAVAGVIFIAFFSYTM